MLHVTIGSLLTLDQWQCIRRCWNCHKGVFIVIYTCKHHGIVRVSGIEPLNRDIFSDDVFLASLQIVQIQVLFITLWLSSHTVLVRPAIMVQVVRHKILLFLLKQLILFQGTLQSHLSVLVFTSFWIPQSSSLPTCHLSRSITDFWSNADSIPLLRSVSSYISHTPISSFPSRPAKFFPSYFRPCLSLSFRPSLLPPSPPTSSVVIQAIVIRDCVFYFLCYFYTRQASHLALYHLTRRPTTTTVFVCCWTIISYNVSAFLFRKAFSCPNGHYRPKKTGASLIKHHRGLFRFLTYST